MIPGFANNALPELRLLTLLGYCSLFEVSVKPGLAQTRITFILPVPVVYMAAIGLISHLTNFEGELS